MRFNLPKYLSATDGSVEFIHTNVSRHEVPNLGNFPKKTMGKNISVSLGDDFENFVDGRISEGRYKNASEVIRTVLRLLEEECRIKSFKQVIQEGIDSGIDRNFNPKDHLKFIKAVKSKNG